MDWKCAEMLKEAAGIKITRNTVGAFVAETLQDDGNGAEWGAGVTVEDAIDNLYRAYQGETF